MEKLERDGMVAVVLCQGEKKGWSTEQPPEDAEIMAMDREIAEAVISGDLEKAKKIAKEKCKNPETEGYKELAIIWVQKEKPFYIAVEDYWHPDKGNLKVEYIAYSVNDA